MIHTPRYPRIALARHADLNTVFFEEFGVVAGGVLPRWRGDGKELFYLAPDFSIMAVPVAANGSAFQPGTPAALFKSSPPAGFDVSADGRKFLLLVPAGDAFQGPFNIVLNWMSLLKK